MSQKLIQTLIDESKAFGNAPTHNLAEYLADELQEIERIRKARLQILEVIQIARDDHKRIIDGISGKLFDLQKTCKHRQRVHHRDPSGGSDSHYECEVCGEIT